MAEKKKDKSDQILKKLEEHDKRFDEIDKKFGEHDKRFGEIDKRFGEIDKRFGEIDRRFDKLENKFDKKLDDVLTGQDKIIKELEIAREDRVFAIAKDREQDRRLDGLEDRTQKLEAKV